MLSVPLRKAVLLCAVQHAGCPPRYKLNTRNEPCRTQHRSLEARIQPGSCVRFCFSWTHVYLRGVILIDYDDGTQEVSGIPDSDVVIYPWRPPELRKPPRPLAQMLLEEQDRERQGSGKPSNHTSASSRPKLQVKAEPPSSPSPRRKRVAPRDSSRRREDHGGRSRAGSGVDSGDFGKNGTRGRRGSSGIGKIPSSPSSYDEGAEDDSEEEDDDDEEDDHWAECPADRERDRSGREGKSGKDRWQHQRGGKGLPGRGRPPAPAPPREKRGHKQGQRKRPMGQQRRNGSALKRLRGGRDGE